MEKLIAALEAATESSFELNAAIARLDFYREAHGDLADNEVPDFCASIDAALTLVPDKYCWFLTKGRAQVCGRLYNFHIFDPALQSVIAKSDGERLEICICIAALKARASISSKEMVGS